MLRNSLIVAAAAILVAAAQNASAQSTSLFGSSGSQSPSGGSGGLQSGGGLQGGGGNGQSGGRSGAGGAFSGPQLNQTGGMNAQSVGRGTGFVGQQNQGAFVGQRLAGTGGGAAAPPSLSGLGALGGGSNFNNSSGSQQAASNRKGFRPRYRLGFQYQPAAALVSRRAETQVSRLGANNPNLSGLRIVVDDEGVAEISGQASSDDARRLIENLVRLEPGVRRVTNLVEVAPAAENPQ